MIAQKAPLIVERIIQLTSKFEFHEKGQEKVNVKELFSSYDIEIDIEHWEASEKKSFFNMVNIKINEGHSKPGYAIEYDVIGEFKIDNSIDLTEDMMMNLTFTSAFGILLSYARAKISSITADAPVGSYILPSINVQELISAKAEEQERKLKKSKEKQ